MKNFTNVLIVAATFNFSAFVHAESAKIQTVKVDWNNANSLSDSFVQQCDDTSIDAIDVVIPGVANKDFAIDMLLSIATGKVAKPECSVEKTSDAKSTTYRFNATGGCSIQIQELRPVSGKAPKTARYEISDAC